MASALAQTPAARLRESARGDHHCDPSRASPRELSANQPAPAPPRRSDPGPRTLRRSPETPDRTIIAAICVAMQANIPAAPSATTQFKVPAAPSCDVNVYHQNAHR
eukprot:1500871-Pyramimonas_sp.AAC.2